MIWTNGDVFKDDVNNFINGEMKQFIYFYINTKLYDNKIINLLEPSFIVAIGL